MKSLANILLFLVISASFSEEIIMSPDLEIEEPEGVIFDDICDLATDSISNIYILDRKEKVVYRFSEDGKFKNKIGKAGQGPGEFGKPCSIFIDSKDILYVLDESNRRIEVFDNESRHIRSVKITIFPIGSLKSVIADKKGDIYISGYYQNENKGVALARYSSLGNLIAYFPIPTVEYNGIQLNETENRKVKNFLGGGSMCFDDEGMIYFSYKWPYLIKILTKDGNELFETKGVSSLNWTPFIFRIDLINGMLWGETTHSRKVFILNNKYVVNSIFAVDWQGNPKKKILSSVLHDKPEEYFKIGKKYGVLDIYNKNMEFVASAKIEGNVYFLSADKKGRIVGIKQNEGGVPKVIRNNIEILKGK